MQHIELIQQWNKWILGTSSPPPQINTCQLGPLHQGQPSSKPDSRFEPQKMRWHSRNDTCPSNVMTNVTHVTCPKKCYKCHPTSSKQTTDQGGFEPPTIVVHSWDCICSFPAWMHRQRHTHSATGPDALKRLGGSQTLEPTKFNMKPLECDICASLHLCVQSQTYHIRHLSALPVVKDICHRQHGWYYLQSSYSVRYKYTNIENIYLLNMFLSLF